MMTDTDERTGRWSPSEHALFLEGLKLHGRLWRKIASMIKTRSIVQIRTHAQKYFLKQQNGLKVHNDNYNRSSCHNIHNRSLSSHMVNYYNHHNSLSAIKRHRAEDDEGMHSLHDTNNGQLQSSSDGLFDSGLDLPNINANVDEHNDNIGGDFMRHKPLKIQRVLTPEQEKRMSLMDMTNSPTSVGLTPYLDIGIVLGAESESDKEDVNDLLEEIDGDIRSCMETETDYSKAFHVDGEEVVEGVNADVNVDEVNDPHDVTVMNNIPNRSDLSMTSRFEIDHDMHAEHEPFAVANDDKLISNDPEDAADLFSVFDD